METVLDYLKEYGDCSFRDMPMTEVDSLALCQLSYLKFDGMVPGVRENSSSVTLQSLKEHPDYEKLFADVRYEEVNRALIEGMLAGKRFRNMKLNCYVNIIEKQWETQFSAITYILDDGTVYVAYRGTDETIVGWKEDFNMAFLSPVPGQEYSVGYLNSVADRIRVPFYVGGHSKGGNLAVYAAAFCNSVAQKRVQAVYNYDGPGFDDKVLSTAGYKSICGRVNTFVPQSSIIGMLLGHEEKYTIVHSYQNGILQHDLCSWKVAQNRFCNLETVDNSSRFIDDTLKTWLSEMNYEEREKFVDGVYSVICETHINSIREMSSRRLANLRTVIKSTQKLDDETREAVLKALRLLVESTKASLVRMIENRE